MSTVREVPQKAVGRGSRSVARSDRPLVGVEDLLENLFSGSWMGPVGWRRPLLGEMGGLVEMKFPRVDVVDREGELLVRAELPGVSKEEVEIAVADDFLTLTVKRAVSEKESSEHYFRAEMARGSMERTIPLPVDVVGDKAKAELKNGILELVIPKAKKISRHRVDVR